MSKKRKKQKTLSAAVATTATATARNRNTVALNPLLRKSAVHEKSAKARRQSDKVNLKKTWFERVAA